MKEHSYQPTDIADTLFSDTSFDNVCYQDIQKLYHHKVIDEQGRAYAERTFIAPLQWELWMVRLCIGLGTALLLLGVVFFFAFNWGDMPAWSKLALIEVTMVVLFGTSVIVGVRRFVGQCMVLSGTICIGVFFAVFGQIYQTGANAWQLFTLWSVLMFGFVWASQFSAQWLLQWSITALALMLFLEQYTRVYSITLVTSYVALYWWCIWGVTIVLARYFVWFDRQWLKSLIAAVALVTTNIIVLADVFEGSLISAVPVFIVIGIVITVLRSMKRELLTQVFAAASLAINTWVVVCYACVRWLFNNYDDEVATVAFMLLVTIVLSVVLYQGVMKLKHDFESTAHGTYGVANDN